MYFSLRHERISGLCNLVVNPSSHYQEYLTTINPKIKVFLDEINARNGVAFFQLMATDSGIKVFEMGYRINGNNDYKDIEKFNNISYMKMLISYSLSGNMGDDNTKDNPLFGCYLCTLVLNCHAGTVEKIDYSKLIGHAGLGDIYCEIKPGKIIVEDGTTQQKAISVRLKANTIKEIATLIDFVNENVTVEDTNGNNMLFKPFDISKLCR